MTSSEVRRLKLYSWPEMEIKIKKQKQFVSSLAHSFILLTNHDVVPNDSDPLVPVGPCVLVPEPDDVAQLVDDDAKLVAVLADGDGLGAVAALANEGAATKEGKGQTLRQEIFKWEVFNAGGICVVILKCDLIVGLC